VICDICDLRFAICDLCATQRGATAEAPFHTPGVGMTCLVRDLEGAELGFWRNVPCNGRFGILNDPGGAVFCIMDPNQIVEPS